MTKLLISLVAIAAVVTGSAAVVHYAGCPLGGCCSESAECAASTGCCIKDCCDSSADCCYPGSPCCSEECCFESVCCKTGSPCCEETKVAATPVSAVQKAKSACCAD